MGIGSESLECFCGFLPACAALQALTVARNISRAPLLAQDFFPQVSVNGLSPCYVWCAHHDAFEGAQWGPLDMSTFDIKTQFIWFELSFQNFTLYANTGGALENNQLIIKQLFFHKMLSHHFPYKDFLLSSLSLFYYIVMALVWTAWYLQRPLVALFTHINFVHSYHFDQLISVLVFKQLGGDFTIEPSIPVPSALFSPYSPKTALVVPVFTDLVPWD